MVAHPARRTSTTPRPRLALADGLDFAGDTAMAAAFAADRRRRPPPARRRTVHVPVGPLVEAGDLLYTGPWVAERLAGLEPFLATHPDDVLPVIRAVLERGRDFTAVDAFRARHRLQELRAELRPDLGATPTSCCCRPCRRPSPAPSSPRSRSPATSCSAATRSSPTCSTSPRSPSRPARTADGRPVGVTLLGPAFSEARLFAAATSDALITPAEEAA